MINIYYISDLHLDRHIQDEEVVETSINDWIKNTVDIVSKPFQLEKGILLIAGDVSDSFEQARMFFSYLSMSLSKTNSQIVFVLGNHELWCDDSFEGIIKKYKSFEEYKNIFVCHNELLELNDNEELKKIRDITDVSTANNIIIYCNTGFSYYNIEGRNQSRNIYRNCRISLEEEKEKCDECFRRVIELSHYPNPIIVLTHTPISDWCKLDLYFDNFYFVNGHNHTNYIDKKKHIYSDNQCGLINTDRNFSPRKLLIFD